MHTPMPNDIGATRLAWHPTADLLAVATLEQQVVVWSTTSDIVVARRSTDGLITSLAWSPDGTADAIGTADETITIWRPATDDATALPDHGSDSRLEVARLSTTAWQASVQDPRSAVSSPDEASQSSSLTFCMNRSLRSNASCWPSLRLNGSRSSARMLSPMLLTNNNPEMPKITMATTATAARMTASTKPA